MLFFLFGSRAQYIVYMAMLSSLLVAITNLTHNKHNKIKTTSQLREEFNTTNFVYIYFNLATFGRANITTQTQPHNNN